MKLNILIVLILFISTYSVKFIEQCSREYFGCVAKCLKTTNEDPCKEECLKTFNECREESDKYIKELLNKKNEN